MSVYLGQDKIGICDIIKANTYESNERLMSDDVYTPWVRPEGWPDLDSLNLEMSGTESFIYMTYRTGHPEDIFSCQWTLVSGQSITIDEGNIVNGEFVSTSTPYTTTQNTNLTISLTQNDGYSEGYIVFKVTGRFSKFWLKDITNNGVTVKYYMQPLLERIWYVPELTLFYNGSSASSTGSGTVTLERDKIANGTGTALTSMYYAWYQCYRLQSLDISGLNTPNVTNMSYAFDYCQQLEYLDVSNLNTANVTSMQYMFESCFRLKEIDLRTWNTAKFSGGALVAAFRYCYALQRILGLEGIYTNNLTSFASLFAYCQSLQDVSGVKNWNTSKVTNFGLVFYGCWKLKYIDISQWDVTKATTIQQLFYNCRNVEYIKFPAGPTGTLSGSQSGIFYYCENLQEVDLSWISPITSSVTSLGYLFYHCRSLKEINIPEGWDVTGCTATESFFRMFSNCYKVEHINGISNWDASGYNYSMNYFFDGCYCLKELNIKNWCPHPTTLYSAFNDCHALEEIDLTGWHWENMTSTAVYAIFSNCWSLKRVAGIEHMGDSGNITSFQAVFNTCYSLTSIPDISTWNPAKVTTCSQMFYNCYSLRSVTIKNWSLPKCTTIENMFGYCYNLEELDLTGWSIPALTTNPGYIFAGVRNLVKFSGLPIKLNFRITNNYAMPEDQWVQIFTVLPSVSGKTLLMTGAILNRLSATTKAIATSKGWTLSN